MLRLPAGLTFNTVGACVVAAGSQLPPTTRDRRQTSGTPCRAPGHPRPRARLQQIASVRWAQRRWRSRPPPSPSRRVCRAMRLRPARRKASGRIADDGGGPPEPLLQEMIREVFQPGLDSPVVFTRDEHETIGIADL